MTDEIVRDFSFEGKQVRAFLDENGEPWFVARDACQILGLENVSRALSSLDSEEKMNITESNVGGIAAVLGFDTSNGGRAPIIINESGLYCLIFKSKKEEARRFQKWVTHEVLPQIRKTGSYSSKTPTTDEFLEMIMSNPRLIARSLERMADQQEEIERQKRQIEEQRPHVELANSISVSNDLITITDLCKIICQTGTDMKVRTLFAMMRSDGYLFKNDNTPTKRAIDMGVLKMVEHPFLHSDGTTGINKYAKVTGKGQIFFVRKYGAGEFISKAH